MSDKLGPVDIEFFLKNVNIKEESQKVRDQIKGIGTTANDTNNVLKTLGAGLGAYMSFQAIKQFGGELINVTGEFQKYEAVLKNSLGSQKEASDAMSMLADKAATTPAQLSELADAYVRLVNQGFKPTADELTKLSDIASATGKGVGQLAEAIIDAQTGEFERLKEFGIRAAKEGDKVSFTFKGVKQQVDFTAKSIQNYILGLGDLNGVSGASAAIMGTLVGQVSNLQDAYAQMLNEIGRGNEGILSGGIEGLSLIIKNYKEIGDVLKVLVATYGAYKAAVIATIAWEKAKAASAVQSALAGRALTSWEIIHTAVLYKLNAAQQFLNNTIKANPYALALGALTAVIGGLIVYSKWTKSTTESQRAIAEVNKKAGDSFVEEKGKIDMLLDSARNQALTDKQRIEAINKLKEIIPGYNAELSKEGTIVNENTEAIKNYLKQLELKIKMTAVQDELAELWKKERDQIKLVEEAEKNLAETKQRNASGDVYGGDIGIAGASAKFDIVNRASGAVDAAKKKLNETRQVITDLKTEYTSAEKGMSDFFNGLSGKGGKDEKKGRVEILDEEIKKLQEEQKHISNTRAEWEKYDKLIEGKQKERDAITGTKKEDKSEAKTVKDQQKILDELLTRTADYNEKRMLLEFNYQLDRNKLQKEGLSNNVAELDKQHKAELDALEADNLKKSASYRWVYDNIEKMGRKSLVDYVGRLKKEIEAFKGNEEIKLELTKRLAEAEEKLKMFTPNKLKEAAGVLGDMAGLVGEFNQGLAESITNVAGIANGLATMLSAGTNPFQIMSGAIGILTNVVKLFKKDGGETDTMDQWISKLSKILALQKESLEMLTAKDQVAAYTGLLSTLDGQISETETRMKNVYGLLQQLIKVGVKGVDSNKLKEFTNKKYEDLNQDDWNKMLANTSGDINKQLSEMYQSWVDLRGKQQEYIDAQNELLTGSTYDSVVDGLAAAFEDGIYSAEEFTKSFEDLMKKAVLNSLKVQALEGPLKEWYAKFAQMSQSDGGLSQSEIEKLKALYTSIANNAALQFENLKDLTGVDFGSTTDAANNLSGAIKGMSQDSADLLAGQLGGIRIHVADIAAVVAGGMNPNLKIDSPMAGVTDIMTAMRDCALKANDYLFQIEANTRQLTDIKLLLARGTRTTPTTNGYDNDFTERRIAGR